MMKIFLSTYLLLFFYSCLFSQNTVGVINYDPTKTYDGYSLLFPVMDTNTYLLDNCGRVVHEWNNKNVPGQMALLLEDGNLLRTYIDGQNNNAIISNGGASDGVQLMDWNGTVLWDYVVSDSVHRMHHDVAYMPNGHVLIHAWELKTKTDAALVGYDTTKFPSSNKLLSEGIYEVEPIGSNGGNIVWEWHVWDHLIQDNDTSISTTYGLVSKHPELIDVNYNVFDDDFMHVNSIDYNADLDQIMISIHNYGEVWIIDHSTTITEAASHIGGKCGKGGDLLYRWGNPQTYDQGSPTDQIFWGQHNAQWIAKGLKDEGKILVFNNGWDRPGEKYSSVEIFVPPLDTLTGNYIYSSGTAFGPPASEWVYTANPKTAFYSDHISGAQRLENGNTLICYSTKGMVFEITPNDSVVWSYVNPLNGSIAIAQGQMPTANQNAMFRCYKYGTNYAGLSGKILSPGNYIELNPDTSICAVSAGINETIEVENNITIFPNPITNSFHVSSTQKIKSIRITDTFGKILYQSLVYDFYCEINLFAFKTGIYFLQINETFNTIIEKQ